MASLRDKLLTDRPPLEAEYSVSKLAVILVVLGSSTLLAAVSGNRLVGLAAVGLAGLALLTVDVVSLQRALTALIILEITSPIDQYFAQQPDFENLNFVNGFNISVTTLCLVVLISLWLAGVSRKRRFIDRRRRLYLVPIALYVLAVFISVSQATNLQLAAFELVILVQAVAVLAYMIHFIKTRDDFVFVCGVLAVGLAIQALIVFISSIIGELEMGPLKTRSDGGRPGGTLGDPNVLGGYLALVIPLCFGLVLAKVPHKLRALGVVAAFGGFVALMLTLSRGAMLGFGVAAAVFGLTALKRHWIAPLTAVILAFSLLLVAIPLLPALLDRVVDDDPGNGREPLIALAIDVIRANP